jgi:hypothetical protein
LQKSNYADILTNMNKKIITLLLIFTIALSVNTGVVSAVECELNEVKTRTRSDGSTYVGIGASSGYVDEDGCPVSQEDYDKQVAADKKSAQTRSMIVGAGVLIAVAGIVIYKKRKK